MHHQAIDRLAPTLKQTALAADGVIEGVEGDVDEMSFVLGVQWHPEELEAADPAMAMLFKVFVEEARSDST